MARVERGISQREIEMAELFGGIDPIDYEFPEENVPSYDKGSHKERSQYHQPNHQKHWKKERSKHKGIDTTFI